MMRIMAYRTAENLIDGLVMTFVDIDRPKREEQELETRRRLFLGLINGLSSRNDVATDPSTSSKRDGDDACLAINSRNIVV